jgi:membrane protein YdbS with pleckstrin-like domain
MDNLVSCLERAGPNWISLPREKGEMMADVVAGMVKQTLADDTKPCPVCGETIKTAAVKCRFCNTDLTAFAAKRELETEKSIFSGHPAVVFDISQIVPFLVVLVAATVIGFGSGSGIGALYAFLGLVVLSAVIFLYFYLKSRSVHYQITTQRIKLERGLLSKIQENLEMFRIDHFELRKPLGKRLLGQASLHLFSSDAELQNFSIYGLPDIESLAETLRECQLRERARRGLTTFVRA